MSPTATWFLIFLFGGQPIASGPHDLDTCIYMAASARQAHCWNPKQPWNRIGPDGKPWRPT